MEFEAFERRKKKHEKKIENKVKLAEIWDKAGSLEQFLLEASLKVPEVDKLDLIAARSLYFKKSYQKFWDLGYIAAIVFSIVWLLLFFASLVGGEQFLDAFGSSKLAYFVCMAVSPVLLAMFFFADTLASKWEIFVDNYKNGDFVNAMASISDALDDFFQNFLT